MFLSSTYAYLVLPASFLYDIYACFGVAPEKFILYLYLRLNLVSAGSLVAVPLHALVL